MEENNQIQVSLLTYILVVVIGISLIIGYLVKNLNRKPVEEEIEIVENYNNKLDITPSEEKTLEDYMNL